MRKFKNLLFSMTTTVILLGVFAVSIAYATFAESKSGTEYAKEIVYNAHWFEILMLLLVVNLVGSIFRYNLFRRKKWSILMFHFAFICMMAGATITRFFGYEGMMHIREGQTSNEISMEKPSVGISVVSKSGQTEKVRETNLSKLENSEFSESLSIDGKTITVTKETFMPNVAETIVPDEQGEPAVSVFGMNDRNEGQDFILVKGEKKQFEDMSFAIADSTNGAD
ncbi:MAG TPA: cytochrome c biogenesis protein ResB, partial [Paludibacter sp.]|nr:cytochrome c biogenesis protein ResB [Paludibacter sp.]